MNTLMLTDLYIYILLVGKRKSNTQLILKFHFLCAVCEVFLHLPTPFSSTHFACDRIWAVFIKVSTQRDPVLRVFWDHESFKSATVVIAGVLWGWWECLSVWWCEPQATGSKTAVVMSWIRFEIGTAYCIGNIIRITCESMQLKMLCIF